ncbi:Mitotic spindle checkpoint component mad3 [Rhynchospora pubera]|uniref:Mitotic spindle checkpoint component mad3 n=1 Tax=Rhynchospora pubera TaxID=906938 RepID=A0AAV8E0Y9_9POAL|nr:Mitotic spindle checkpoint component mad3 [Rhynchospora pubera]
MATEDAQKEEEQELLSSLVSDIRCYSGSDPLRPWLHGIKRLRAALPPQALKQKLPRFLQKCVQTFESDHRYRNDARYIRVWIELMDYVDDAKVLLKKMEKNKIGLKRASFYIAYALYYEKHRKLEEAEKMYHAGVHILAEPVCELQKSYDQFLQRLELYRKRKSKMQERMPRKGEMENIHATVSKGEGTSENLSSNVVPTKQDKPRPDTKVKTKNGSTKTTGSTRSNNLTRFNSENTIMVRKFVDSAIVGKSVAEMSCHNGLVEPTITTEEAMRAINSMFQEPLDLDPSIQKKSRKKGNKTQNNENSTFEIFADEEERPCKSNKNPGNLMPSMGDFTILPDEEERPCKSNKNPGNLKPSMGDFTILPDEEEGPHNLNGNLKSINHGLKEDTVMIRKFVGSTISEESKVENACHHGLVDPTMNLKEAMDEINGMFRKPMDIPKGEKPKGGQKFPLVERQLVDNSSFSILPDDEFEETNPMHKPNNISEGEKLKRGQKVPLIEKKLVAESSFSVLPDELEGNPNRHHKPNTISHSRFSIVPDEELEENTNPTTKPNYILTGEKPKMGSSSLVGNKPVNQIGFSNSVTEVNSNPTYKGEGSSDGLFEPTFFTQQAMDDINEMFGKEIDF